MVADHMTGRVLRYSARQALIHHATRLGIGRFEANLIIAAVQHRAGGAARPESDDEKANRLGSGVFFITAAIVQATILAGVWWLAF